MKGAIAITSGKGGVGKTTTAANLALYYARQGICVGLIDIDPLSDITTLFDLDNSWTQEITQELRLDKPLSEYTLKIFPNLDILFPLSKLNISDKDVLYKLLSSSFKDEIANNYDLIIYDFPAGVDEYITFLDLADTLLIVTNPEPAAHVGAGAYIKEAAEKNLFSTFYVWHNKYRGYLDKDFNPTDIITNYNKNMPPEEYIDPKSVDILNSALIPDDSSLDLLKGDPRISLQLLRSARDCLDLLHDELLQSIPWNIELSVPLAGIVRFIIRSKLEIKDAEILLNELGAYLRIIGNIHDSNLELFTSDQRKNLLAYLKKVLDDPLHQQIRVCFKVLSDQLDVLEKENSLFSTPAGNSAPKGKKVKADNIALGKALDREFSSLLMRAAKEVKSKTGITNGAGLFLFYFSLYKLFQSDRIITLLDNFIPKKTTKGNKTSTKNARRDRYTQIDRLIRKSKDYRKDYVSLIRSLFPVVLRQLDVVCQTFELNPLILRNQENNIHREAYLKLTGTFIHEAVNSGLGVVFCFDYRPAAQAFIKGADFILKETVGKAASKPS